jgi:cytochrome c-type biogenesis protein CcmH/NrfG
MGTVRLSDKLHNQGLERLKNGDFFHGIEALTKSISINKNNVPSRNLLGLALFEMGHVGEALKHWIISKSMLNEENPAEKYIESANKNARQLERLNDAVGMYNQALGHIKQKSDDLAIIQLKKAVEINPRFVDALNLLTLCYLIQNDRERALSTAERVLGVDINNPVALNYYSIINPGKTRSLRNAVKPKSPQSVSKGPYKSIELEEKKQRNFHFAELLTFLIGVACTAAACYFLLIPALDSARETERQDAAQALAETQADYRQQLNQAETEKAELNQEISRLGDNKQEISGDLAEQLRINDVNRAYFLYINDELRAAVDLLDGFDSYGLPHDIRQRIVEIHEGAYPRLGLEYYNLGLAAFNAPRDSYMALVHLENAHRFLSDEATQYNRLLFMLGVLYYDDEQNRMEEAYAVLSALRERAPNLPHPFTGAERTLFNRMLNSLEERQ